ncbi:MAG TPA: dolichyl-phosphate beta-glucosyltransferase [bacterium]|jgi:dolichyl-phosphate beta-glucosyltransferase|nr:dolichyl-phosphate beta-glucosyltransferase [bacterium]
MPPKARALSAAKRPALSIVVPAFNEERRLGPSLELLDAYARRRRLAYEILVVDDGSTDATAALVRGMQKRLKGLGLLSLGLNRGKGAAVKAGVLAAKAPRILFTDADLSTPIEDLSVLEEALDRGADLAVGSRALDRTRVSVHQPFYREAGGRLFNTLAQGLSVPGIQDTQCGFKLFTAVLGRRVFRMQRVPRFGFDVELLFLARKAGYRIAEVPVHWVNSPETKVRPFRDGGRAFLDLAMIRLYDWQGSYKGL